jgi:type III secretory pathway lipoprotein EscJ
VRTSLGIAVALAFVHAGCSPTVDGPIEHQRTIDRDDGDRLAAQLAALPGAVTANVTLHRATRDPLGVTAPTASSAAVLIVIDDRADRAAVTEHAAMLVHAAAPEIAAPAIIVEVGVHRPALAKVGPFTVEEASRGPLRAALAIALAVIAALAAWVAWRERYRRGNSAQ